MSVVPRLKMCFKIGGFVRDGCVFAEVRRSPCEGGEAALFGWRRYSGFDTHTDAVGDGEGDWDTD